MNNQSVNIERRMTFNAELINKFGISFGYKLDYWVAWCGLLRHLDG